MDTDHSTHLTGISEARSPALKSQQHLEKLHTLQIETIFKSVLLVISDPHAVLDEDEGDTATSMLPAGDAPSSAGAPRGCRGAAEVGTRRERGWTPSSFYRQIGTGCLQTPRRRSQNSFPSSCAFGGRAAGMAGGCAGHRAAPGTLARLSCGLAFKPDRAHWVYRRPCRCPLLKGALLFHGNDLWSPNVFISNETKPTLTVL